MKKSVLITIIAGVLLIILIFANINIHLCRAIIYGSPSIDDVEHSHYDTVPNGVYMPWILGSKHNIPFPSEFEKRSEELKTTAFFVCTDTLLLSEHYWLGYHKDSLSNPFSITKSIVSLLVGQAIEEGFIKSVDDKVVTYLPEFNTNGKETITIKDLLTMSSGFDFDEDDKTLFSPIAKLYYGKNLYKQVCGLKRVKPSGQSFEYQSINTQVLGIILERTTQMPLSFYAASRLWIPLGMRSYALWGKDDKKNTKAFCCLNTVARDLARIGQLIINNGKWNGLQLVPESYVRKATSSVVVRDSINRYEGYGYQFWTTRYKEDNIVYARGILGQYLIIIPSKKLIIVRLGQKRDQKMVNGNPQDLYMWIEAGLRIKAEEDK